jgi:hypothetical protein
MRNKIICSICSKAKDERVELMPARLRYTGTHVAKVLHHAKSSHLPFYILSGVYGFISGDEPIPHYDHLLVSEEVPALIERIVGQLTLLEAGEIVFCTKDKPNWKPYLDAIKQAASRLNISLSVYQLADDD